MKLAFGLLMATLTALLIPPAAFAQNRQGGAKVALLIGNSAYTGQEGAADAWPALPNAEHDVYLVAQSLRRVGFDVTVVPSGTYNAIKAALRSFDAKTTGAQIAVVYYAGHGFEYQRRSYIVPTDAPTVVRQDQIGAHFIDFELMVARPAHAQINVFFVDACRKGIALLRVESKTIAADPVIPNVDDVDFPEGDQVAILYSAARGRSAYDAAPPPEDYSPFAVEVARNIDVPHVEIALLFPSIHDGVRQRTKDFYHPQEPYTYGGAGRGIYLNDGNADVGAPEVAATTSLTADAPAGSALGITVADLNTRDEPLTVVKVLQHHSFAQVKSIAAMGDSVALYLVGYMYELGVGVPKDLVAARMWLERAAATKTPWGELELAYFLAHNGDDQADAARALDLYRAAAAQGVPKAQGHLALILMGARDKDMKLKLADRNANNYNEGIRLLAQAAAGGYPYAIYALALADRENADGLHVAQLKTLARQGDTDADQWLCDLYARIGDPIGARDTCEKAANAGSAIAQARLAIAYHDGLGVTRSDDEARHWTRLALAQSWNDADLQNKLKSYNYSFALQVSP